MDSRLIEAKRRKGLELQVGTRYSEEARVVEDNGMTKKTYARVFGIDEREIDSIL